MEIVNKEVEIGKNENKRQNSNDILKICFLRKFKRK